MAEILPFRNEVPSEKTWDITALFNSDEAFYQTLNETITLAKNFNETYVYRLNQPDTIEEALDAYSNILIQLDRMANYAELRLSVDTTNEQAQSLSSKFSNSYGKIASELSFVESEILILSNDVLNDYIATSKYPHFLQKLKEKKAYQLSPEVEKTLASLSPVFERPFELYGITKMLDIDFESFEHNGHTYPLDYATFENEYEDHPNEAFRRISFKKFSDALN